MQSHIYNKYLDPIDKDLPKMAALLRDWGNINSGSTHLKGLDRMLDALCQHFASLGAKIETIALPDQELIDNRGEKIKQPLGKAFRVTKRPEAKIQVFLGGHYDTVFPENHPFQKTTDLDANTLQGPGVTDLKGGIVILHRALTALESFPDAHKIGWEVLLNPDEEIGSPGSTPLFQEAAKRHDLGLIFEPSLPDGTIVGKRAGSGNFTVIAHGKAAHAGRDHQWGKSAILALAKIISELEAVNGQIPGVIVNVGHIEGGGPLNVVPDLAIARLNVRIKSRELANEVEKKIKAIVDQANSEKDLHIELHGGFHRMPKEVTESIQKLYDMLKTCAKLEGWEMKMGESGGVCDGNTLAHAGLANIDTLGVRGGGIHSSKEFALLDSLVERSRLTARFLMGLASGELVWKKS